MSQQGTTTELRFKQVGKRLVAKPSRRSVDRANSVSAQISQMDPSEGLDEDHKTTVSMYRYSSIEDTRVSRFTHHQILLV